MKPEEIYDTEIAPALLKIAQRCQELGFPFIACVEWERAEGQRGHTEFCPATNNQDTRPTSGQLLVHYAARSKGNIDIMLMGVIKDSRKYGHSSMYLRQLGVPLTPSANTGTQTCCTTSAMHRPSGKSSNTPRACCSC